MSDSDRKFYQMVQILLRKSPSNIEALHAETVRLLELTEPNPKLISAVDTSAPRPARKLRNRMTKSPVAATSKRKIKTS